MGYSKINNIIILLIEIGVIFLMVFGVLPREASLFLTGLLSFYFIFCPLKDALWVFIASIPLFVALPISQNFDSMANWRILLSILFVVMFFKSGGSFQWLKAKISRFKPRKHLSRYPLESLAIIFLIISALSIFAAENPWVGIKKLLFLSNIFLLFIIIKILTAQKKEIIYEIIESINVAVGIFLAVGFAQLIVVFYTPLHTFWQFWAKQVIPVFYGKDLSNLLSESNTWFSYYNYQPPALRMFSVFPDSHSFAFLCILAVPFFLTLIFLRPKESRGEMSLYYFLLIVCFLAIIFSGSRGTWLSALLAMVAFFFFILLFLSPTIRSWTTFFIPKTIKKWTKQMQLILGSLIIFFLLFPISSGIILLSQTAQVGFLDIDKISLFERAKSITDLSELSAKSRLQIWQRTADSIIAHPIAGIGLGNFPLIIQEDVSAAKRGASAHNLYLDFAAEIGIFGFLILLTIFGLIFKKAWFIFTEKQRAANSYLRAWSGFFILALVWILGYSLFDVVLLNDKVFLFFMAALGLLYSGKYESK